MVDRFVSGAKSTRRIALLIGLAGASMTGCLLTADPPDFYPSSSSGGEGGGGSGGGGNNNNGGGGGGDDDTSCGALLDCCPFVQGEVVYDICIDDAGDGSSNSSTCTVRLCNIADYYGECIDLACDWDCAIPEC